MDRHAVLPKSLEPSEKQREGIQSRDTEVKVSDPVPESDIFTLRSSDDI